MPHLLAMFDRVRIINLVDRPDRRREVTAQVQAIGGFDGGRIDFLEVQRPADAGPFPSLGARGCFESQLTLLRQARDAGASSVVIMEDDLDFTPDAATRGPALLDDLARHDWAFFYGAHGEAAPGRSGLVAMPAEQGIITAAFLAVNGPVIAPLVAWLEAVQSRPAGSPDYGPMHVDGAYSVFRAHHPELATYAAFPPLGRQRSSRSDITPRGMLLDRFALTRPLANLLRSARRLVRG
ncbi:glycosyltransferase family 25 protein [Sphingomonas nostoxanthinifaciens]|uniref:hypothetical protein n=1 Tax=Sphingomonas nostoxanthinifaciens TaxID=2872652 RepID=UPI001CC21723|nr:hypothetical protein [Sphingomonas nostoxanthinifaciens]UAK24316.1 hypothetical protein K8P63_18710 [Sphingomonas nostoxanthinifaciens]